MNICPIYLDDPAHPGRHAAALARWCEIYRRSPNRHEIVVVTDLTSPVQAGLGAIVERINDEPPWATHQLHRVGWLRAWAARLCAPCWICDTDLEIYGELLSQLATSAISRNGRPTIGLVRDPGGYTYPEVPGWMDGVIECNSGMILAGCSSVGDEFKHAYHALSDTRFHLMPNVEQVLWSIVRHRLGGVLLGDELNWSRLWGGAPGDHATWHPHGDAKWKHREEQTEQ